MDDLGIPLIAVGITLLLAGLASALGSFVITRRREVINVDGATQLTEVSAASNRPYRGLVVPLHYSFTQLRFSFRETSGKDVEAKIMDLVPEYGGGHVVMTYREATGRSGALEVGLQPGTYDIHISSTDAANRNVEYTVRGVEITYSLSRYLEVALATATIGAVALVQGLVLVVG